MAKTLISGPILRPLIFFCELYLYLPDTVTSYHPMQFTGKLTNQTWENGKKPNKFRAQFWPIWPKCGRTKIVLWVLSLLVIINYSKLTSYAISSKINELHLRKCQKNLILGLNLGPKIFFASFTSTSS